MVHVDTDDLELTTSSPSSGLQWDIPVEVDFTRRSQYPSWNNRARSMQNMTFFTSVVIEPNYPSALEYIFFGDTMTTIL